MFENINKIDPAKALKTVRAQVAEVLRRLELASFVSLDEIEKELRQAESAFKSLLLLGILRRIMVREDDKVAQLFIPAITEWKNYLPHGDLDGLSPFEYQEKYPPGPHETRFIARLLEEYQSKLESVKDNDQSFDLEKDFKHFQEEYLERIPLDEYEMRGRPFTLKELIIEERRQRGWPVKNIYEIGAQIFAENTADGLGIKAAKIDDKYYQIVNRLAEAKKQRLVLKKKEMKEILAFFKKFESYYRSAPDPHRFYLNYAGVLLLGGDSEGAISALDRALLYDPNYEHARHMKAALAEYIEGKN